MIYGAALAAPFFSMKRTAPCPTLALVGVLIATTLLIYWPGLSGGYLFDDYSNLLLEHAWRIDALSIDQISRSLRHGGAGPLGRPLALLSFGLTYFVTGLDPYWFKLGNLILHCANGVLVFALCKELLRELAAPASAAPSRTLQYPLVAAVCALVWLVHPMQVSTVMYAVQRMEIGAATGVLISLYGYIRARRDQLLARSGRGWLALAAAGLALGLGFKESAVLAGGFALLIETTFFGFRGPGGKASLGWVALYVASLVGAAILLVNFAPSVISPNGLYSIREFNAYERAITQAPVLVMYLGQSLLPLPSSFLFYYDSFPVSRTIFDFGTAMSIALLTTVVVIALVLRRRWPLTAFGVLWFFIGHSLTSSIIPLELAFEHRNYLPLLGLVLAAVQPLSVLVRRLQPSRPAMLIIATALLGTLGLLCIIQTSSWGNPMLLAMTLEQRNPHSQRASYDLARQYLSHAGDDTSNPLWSMAARQMELAASLPGPSPLPAHGVILLNARAGIKIAPDKWDDLRSKLTSTAIGPEGRTALYAISNCRIKGDCVLDEGQLLKTFIVVLRRNPENASVHTMYSNFLWNVLGDRALAVSVQREAVKLSPDAPYYRIALAKFLIASGSGRNHSEATQIILQLQRENTDGLLDQELSTLNRMLARQ